MSTANKAWYWLAAGVLALGLNGYYQDGGLQGLHRLAERGSASYAQARAQVGQMVTLAEVAWAEHARCQRPVRAEVAVDNAVMPAQVQTKLAEAQARVGEIEAARIQARVAALQEVIARREMERAQVAIQNGRIAVWTKQGQVQVALPQLPRLEVRIPQPPAVVVTAN